MQIRIYLPHCPLYCYLIFGVIFSSSLQGYCRCSWISGGGWADHPTCVCGEDPRADQEIRQGARSVV